MLRLFITLPNIPKLINFAKGLQHSSSLQLKV